MALLQIPKNHKACLLELRACIPENSGIIEAYPLELRACIPENSLKTQGCIPKNQGKSSSELGIP